MLAALVAQEKTNYMNLIIPMAGKGTRLRPHTLSTPKPLLEIAGKSIVQRIVDLVSQSTTAKIKNIGFIIESKNVEIESMLFQMCSENNILCTVFYQGNPRGTAHAIYSAKKLLKGPTLIIFADTLFETSLSLSLEAEGCIFVKEVKDPSAYGVVKINKKGHVTEFVEKPKNPISNLAIIGLYYFKEGQVLSQALKEILDHEIIEKGEYQITTALENLKKSGLKFSAHTVDKWLDFGTPKNVLASHLSILNKEKISYGEYQNTTITPPCYIHPSAKIKNSVIGPNVSIGKNTTITASTIQNSIIQSNSRIEGAIFNNSIIGHHVDFTNNFNEVSIGDYCKFK